MELLKTTIVTSLVIIAWFIIDSASLSFEESHITIYRYTMTAYTYHYHQFP